MGRKQGCVKGWSVCVHMLQFSLCRSLPSCEIGNHFPKALREWLVAVLVFALDMGKVIRDIANSNLNSLIFSAHQ